jgi:xylose isomerase
MADDIKFAVILGFMGQTRDRFQVFGPEYTLAQKVARAAQVENCGAVEVVYPGEFQDVAETKKLLDDNGLACSTVNVNVKADPVFHMGGLTSPKKAIRDKAIEYLKTGMDISVEMGCNMITCCPLGDGHDYSFQIDYTQAWGWYIEGIREAAKHRDDVKLSLEYKPNETRARVIMGSAASALHVCDQVGLPNVGVTIDIGHALYAPETPSLSMAQLHHAGRLFLVHINDNYRNWDWDLVPGSVNWWDWIECLLYMEKVGYDYWVVSDVMPARLDSIEVLNAVSRSIKRGKKLLSKVDKDALWAAIQRNDAMAAYDLFYAALGLDE